MTREGVRFVFSIAGLALLTGCSGFGGAKKPAPPEPADPAETAWVDALSRSAQDIRDSLRVLAATRNAQAQRSMTPEEVAQAAWESSHVPDGLDERVTIQQAVGLREVVSFIAEEGAYDWRVLGTPPVPDLLVQLNVVNAPFVDVLRDAGQQAGRAADIVIYPYNRLIEILYFSHNEAVRHDPGAPQRVGD